MSHFAGLVVMTPDYANTHDLGDALAKYDENLEVPEYSRGEVEDFEKIQFIEYYQKNKMGKNLKEILYENLVKSGEVEPYNQLKHKCEKERYLYVVMSDHKDEYVELFKQTYPELFVGFDELYNEKGGDWNGWNWRINHLTCKWESYSTYNPNSKWDWYDECGRWSGCVKTKSGEYVNECLLGEIDWADFKPEDYDEEEKTSWDGKKYHKLKEGVKYHFTKSDIPFCLVIDGEWVEKGHMGWWAMTSNEMSDEDWNKKLFDILEKLPEDSQVYNIDFHI